MHQGKRREPERFFQTILTCVCGLVRTTHACMHTQPSRKQTEPMKRERAAQQWSDDLRKKVKRKLQFRSSHCCIDIGLRDGESWCYKWGQLANNDMK